MNCSTDRLQLPWYSVSEADFPAKGSKRRRRRPRPQLSSSPLELPPRIDSPPLRETQEKDVSSGTELFEPSDIPLPTLEPSGSVTPTTSKAPSEAESSQPTTPSSAVVQPQTSRPPPSSGGKPGSRHLAKIIPVVPILPSIPSLSRSSKRKSVSIVSEKAKVLESPKNADHLDNALGTAERLATDDEEVPIDSEQTLKASSPHAKATPKSWADLLKVKAPATIPPVSPVIETQISTSNGLQISKAGSLSEVLNSFSVKDDEAESRVAFLKPRGLVNTGNMCYMNSVLCQ